MLRRRWRGVDVLIIPARVQGDGAAAGNRRRHSRWPIDSRRAPDVLVVGRGGGSLEDLWAFNEEPVVRAIAASRIPTVSAVGHEIDVTLADLAADVRALTPSEAAERVVPAADEITRALARLSASDCAHASASPRRRWLARGSTASPRSGRSAGRSTWSTTAAAGSTNCRCTATPRCGGLLHDRAAPLRHARRQARIAQPVGGAGARLYDYAGREDRQSHSLASAKLRVGQSIVTRFADGDRQSSRVEADRTATRVNCIRE